MYAQPHSRKAWTLQGKGSRRALFPSGASRNNVTARASVVGLSYDSTIAYDWFLGNAPKPCNRLRLLLRRLRDLADAHLLETTQQSRQRDETIKQRNGFLAAAHLVAFYHPRVRLREPRRLEANRRFRPESGKEATKGSRISSKTYRGLRGISFCRICTFVTSDQDLSSSNPTQGALNGPVYGKRVTKQPAAAPLLRGLRCFGRRHRTLYRLPDPPAIPNRVQNLRFKIPVLAPY